MTEDERWQYILDLDEELLLGSVMLSEWSVFQIKDADTAFAGGAFLATIMTALAGVESHLRWLGSGGKAARLVDLIRDGSLEDDLAEDLDKLRKFRNRWVHVGDPEEDEALLANPAKHERQLEEMAFLAARSLRRVIYSEQGV